MELVQAGGEILSRGAAQSNRRMLSRAGDNPSLWDGELLEGMLLAWFVSADHKGTWEFRGNSPE